MNKSASTTPKTVSFPWIVENYDVILFDAYGVLVNGSGAIDGAVGALDLLKKQKKNYLILTNGATRTIPIMAKRYQQKGLDIPENKIFSSGSRLFHAFRNLGLIQPKCLVLGPESSHDLVRENGGKVLSLDSIESNYNEVDALVIANQSGYPFEKTLNDIINFLFYRYDNSSLPSLIVANCDLLYPYSDHKFGITAGAAYLIIKGALQHRYPGVDFDFHLIGKPSSYLFEAAKSLYKNSKMIMIGDQLQTDILGANSAGIHSALISTGLCNWKKANHEQIDDFPTYLIPNLLLT